MMVHQFKNTVIASKARQSMKSWIAASLTLLAITAIPEGWQIP